MNVILLRQAPVFPKPWSMEMYPDWSRSCDISTACSFSDPMMIGKSISSPGSCSTAVFEGADSWLESLTNSIVTSFGVEPANGRRLKKPFQSATFVPRFDQERNLCCSLDLMKQSNLVIAADCSKR